MMKVIIIAAGNINIEFLKEYTKNNKFDYVIAVDKGLDYCVEANLCVNMILGDFDSVNKKNLKNYMDSCEVVVFPKEKDYTDLHLAIEKAMEKHPNEIYILGATGNRMDHFIINVGLLSTGQNDTARLFIVDEKNKIYIINKNITLRKDELFGKYISVIPYAGVAEGVTLIGMKYQLNNYNLKPGESIGCSNEAKLENISINLRKGRLIIVESRD